MPMTSKEMIKFLKQNGSHKKLVCEETGRAVIVPYHSRDLKKGMEKAILKQAGLL